MENFHINHFAVAVCAIVNLALGALWYSPALFYKSWLRENNLTGDDIKKANTAKMYGLSFVFSLITSYNLAFFLGDDKTDLSWGLTAGFLTGFGFSALIFAVVALFEQRSWKYIFINGGYITMYYTIIGAILGAWR